MAFLVAVEAFLVARALLLLHCTQHYFQAFAVIVIVIIFFVVIFMASNLPCLFYGFAQL
jgi:hypothetical protein